MTRRLRDEIEDPELAGAGQALEQLPDAQESRRAALAALARVSGPGEVGGERGSPGV